MTDRDLAWVRRRLAALLFGSSALIAAGCLAQRTGTAAEAEADGAADTNAEVAATDAAAIDSAAGGAETVVATEVADAPGPGCVPGLAMSAMGVARFEGRDGFGGPFMLDGTRLYSAQRTYRANGGSTSQLVTVDLAEEQERKVVYESERDQLLLDARDGVVLHALLRGDGTARRLYLRRSSGEEIASLIEPGRDGRDLRMIPGAYDWAPVPHMIDGESAAWAERLGTYGGPTRVRGYHDGRITLLYEGDAHATAPYVRGEHALFVTFGEPRTLWLAHLGGEVRPIAEGEISELALSRDAAWWLVGRRVMRFDRATEEVSELPVEGCGALIASETRAAAVCGAEVEDYGWYVALPGQPMIFDGDEVTAVDTLGGEVLAGLSFRGGRLAWVEYPSGVGCYDMDPTVGELVVAGIAEPNEPRRVTDVSAGCWCCDAFWPPLTLGLSNEALVWNYPSGVDFQGFDWERLGNIGWGLFDEGCD